MKRIVCSNVDPMSPSARKALNEVYRAIRSAYDVMAKYEDNIEQILNDPSYFDATMDEVRYLEELR